MNNINENFSKFGFNFENRSKRIVRNIAKNKGCSMSDIINQMVRQRIDEMEELGFPINDSKDQFLINKVIE